MVRITRNARHISTRNLSSDGADEVQHINFIILNFFAPLVKDTRTPERFTAVGENAAKLDLQSKPVDDFVSLLREHHTTVDVTLATFEGMFTGRPGKPSPDYVPMLSRLPAQVQRGAYTGGLPVTAKTDQLYKDSYENMLRMTKRMYDAGIPLLAGTDAAAESTPLLLFRLPPQSPGAAPSAAPRFEQRCGNRGAECALRRRRDFWHASTRSGEGHD
jgi:hypothetical protein